VFSGWPTELVSLGPSSREHSTTYRTLANRCFRERFEVVPSAHLASEARAVTLPPA
jgi:hypothetical protein